MKEFFLITFKQKSYKKSPLCLHYTILIFLNTARDSSQVCLALVEQIPFAAVLYFKDTHRKKAPSNKTPVLRKGTNMGVWAVGTLNQLAIRGS